MHKPSVLTIAGTDPSGGAGIQADIKAISATGSYAASVITALVAQNTQGVQAIEDVAPQFVRKQIDSVLQDLDIKAVKIGMLHKQEIIAVIASALVHYPLKYIVFDPVMVAKDGSALLDLATIDFLKQHLLSKVHLITPNIFEAEHLLDKSIKNSNEMEAAAQVLAQEFNINVLIKGGHLDGPKSADVLYEVEHNRYSWYESPRITTKNTHGTGCTYSSAIASYLAQGFELREAIAAAKHYLTRAIESGALCRIGQGNGPVDHFYFLPVDFN